jgi:hypothetical protein
MTGVTERRDRLAAMVGAIPALLANVNAVFERSVACLWTPRRSSRCSTDTAPLSQWSSSDRLRAIRLAGKLTEAASARLR